MFHQGLCFIAGNRMSSARLRCSENICNIGNAVLSHHDSGVTGVTWNYSVSSLFKVFNWLFKTSLVSRLQEKVQETIEALRLAGIKVWVLTGDKHETAVSVSLSCGHFHRTMNILELVQHKSDSTCAEQLRQLAKR